MFVALNIALFLLMCVVVYYDRFLQYRGRGNLHEFFLYAAVIVMVILIAWQKLRRYDVRPSALALAEVGILAHFSGAFVPIHGGRLYDARLYGIGYDKLVHGFNAFAACWVLGQIFEAMKLRLGAVRLFVIVLSVLGLGALVEIVEYLVSLTVQNSGVGGYDNNMQDMMGNFVGGLVFSALSTADQRRRDRREEVARLSRPTEGGKE